MQQNISVRSFSGCLMAYRWSLG